MMLSGMPCLEAVEAAPMRNECPENWSGGIPDLASTERMW